MADYTSLSLMQSKKVDVSHTTSVLLKGSGCV